MADTGRTCVHVRDAAVTAGETTLLSVPELVIRRGERIAVTGPSGSGKTTLLRLLAGLVAEPLAVEGSVERHGTVGFVAQDSLGSLNPLVRCRRQVALVAGSEERADEALRACGITDEQARRHPLRLSGGQRQRVAIAAALSRDPDVIFADEPTSSLDSIATLAVADALREATVRTGAALVVSTHDMGVAKRVADRVIRVEHGAITEVDHADLH
ncbi:ATP-binding cassette domain-containing protein [Corynebacterium sp. 335C]